MATDLGSAGSYLDAGTIVVPVTSEADAQRVRAAGGVAKIVRYGAADLRDAIEVLDRDAVVPGTTWGVDPTTDQVVVTTDDTVTGDRLAQLTAVVSRLGDRVRVESSPGVLSRTINGGKATYSGPYRCSLGFNVRNGNSYYFLTAGHCTATVTNWYSDSGNTKFLGSKTGASPTIGDDYGLVKYAAGVAHPGSVYLYGAGTQDIRSFGNGYVGEPIRRSGSTTGVHSGQVTALNVTVNYSDGTVYGLIQTSACAQSGDSGGPLFDKTIALGLLSGSAGDCVSGGTTFFQPVKDALTAYNVRSTDRLTPYGPRGARCTNSRHRATGLLENRCDARCSQRRPRCSSSSRSRVSSPRASPPQRSPARGGRWPSHRGRPE